jgi:hypothetical protein
MQPKASCVPFWPRYQDKTAWKRSRSYNLLENEGTPCAFPTQNRLARDCTNPVANRSASFTSSVPDGEWY